MAVLPVDLALLLSAAAVVVILPRLLGQMSGAGSKRLASGSKERT